MNLVLLKYKIQDTDDKKLMKKFEKFEKAYNVLKGYCQSEYNEAMSSWRTGAKLKYQDLLDELNK